MKIQNYSKIYDAYLRQAQATQDKNNTGSAANGARSSGSSKKDEIILSPRATEVRELAEKVKTYPEVRQGKVEAVKQQIQANTYAVNGKLVAKSMTDLLS